MSNKKQTAAQTQPSTAADQDNHPIAPGLTPEVLPGEQDGDDLIHELPADTGNEQSLFEEKDADELVHEETTPSVISSTFNGEKDIDDLMHAPNPGEQ